MYDLSIIRSFTKKDNYQKYRNFLKGKDFSKELQPVLEVVDDWYAKNATEPSVEDLANLLFARGVSDAQQAYYRELFTNLATVPVPDSVTAVLERFKAARLCEQIAFAAYNVSTGIGRLETVQELVGQLQTPASEVGEEQFVTDDIDEILRETVLTQGLRWRLKSLNRSLGSLRKGDFGFVFARPETGKTTFLADQTTYMSSQLQEDSGPVLWFNNEEQGKKVRLRTYEAALGARLDQLVRGREKAKRAYLEATKGKLKIYDSPSITRQAIEALCREHKPSLIVIDQIDKIQGFENDRKDLEMGAIYQWGRDLAKTYAPVIGICQADGTGENVKWLTMANVANAKTAKQAEADWILGIGKIHEAGYEKIRYLNISKNKLVGDSDSDPAMRHAQIEVFLDAERARYEDIQ